MNQHYKTGQFGEQAAFDYLTEHGVTILHKNFRCRRGEIDLIGRDGEYLIVAEVKTRRGSGSGTPAEAVDYRKQKRIAAAFRYYCMKYQVPEYEPVRFDVIEVNEDLKCHWIKNAFEWM